MAESTRNFRYRYDLDGLRGIAIGLVVLYHVFVGRVSGGVDVFLLLSGYFFLGSQLRYADKPNASFNPWWPIWRTLRRLVPALALTVGATFLLVTFFTPQLLRTELVQQITATVFYYQNWELARQNADYAAASASTSPLQHLWSMAVQGQFYVMSIALALGLGLLVRALGRRTLTVQKIAGPILVIVTLASFAYACRFGLYGPAANYYSTWSRAWELTLGGVLAIYGTKLAIPQRFSNFFTGFGLLALICTGALIANTTAYPGPLSLLPLGGAVLIILGGGGSLSQAMASKKARWLGDIAYPLYLWHWPLLILSTAYLGMERPTWWLGVIIIAISLVLADLTHRFLERPLRQRRKRPTRDDMPVNSALASLRTTAGAWRGVGGVLMGAATIALLAIQPVWMSQVRDGEDLTLDAARYPGAMAFNGTPAPEGVTVQPDPILVGGIMPPTSTSHCFVAKQADPDFYNTERVDGTPCIFGDQDADFKVYLVGGSHAEQWASGLDKLGREMHFQLVPIVRQDCPIELGDDVTVTPECKTWAEGAVEQIVEGGADLVISNTTRPQDFYGHGPDVVPAGYAAFWDYLAEQNIPFMGLRDNPWGFDAAGVGREFDECYVATQNVDACSMDRNQVYAPVDPAAIVLAKYKNMIAVDTSNWFCDDTQCPVIIGNVFVYRDMHHISNAFADSAMPLLRQYIEPFMKGETVQQEAPDAPAGEDPAAPTATPYDEENHNPRTTADVAPYPMVAAPTAV
ncbi:acyltransferase [Corynebacterium phoceense]|uniref:acyltransferase family protein n=1 Tax=Corynebacterium phoceense TaxID=1686286 RepID=UPI00211C8471|nr:acyltransferase family protein [Corynebacterium phoceense]MCQ9337117.1 acyltransferase [Corynebacterium phoceense]